MDKKNYEVKVNNEKPYFLKRFAAYLIDLIIVTLLAGAISLVFLDNTKGQNSTEAYMSLTKKFTSGEITQEVYNKEANELNYLMTKENAGVTIVNIGVALVYYVVLCYFCHGITLGKYLFNMRIVSSKDKELNMGNYLLRALFVNLILTNTLSVVLVSVLDKTNFMSIYPKVSNGLTIFLLATLIFMMYRNDGRGLHDMISGTMVISTKEKKMNVEVTEAKVIEEKEDVKEIKEVSTKKGGTKPKKSTKKTNSKKTGGKK